MVGTKIMNYYHTDICPILIVKKSAAEQKDMKADKEGHDEVEEENEQANYGVAESIKRNLKYVKVLAEAVNQGGSITETSARTLKEWSKVAKYI